MEEITDRDVPALAAMTEKEEAATHRAMSPEEKLHLAQHDAQKDVAITGGDDLMGTPESGQSRDFERGT